MNKVLLEHFIKLYKVGNITRAAEELFLSRQTLSGNIAKLEAEVGSPLFTRSREGVELTEAGYLLRDFAEREEARYHDGELDYAQTVKRIQEAQAHANVTIAFPVNMLSREAVEIIAMLGDGSNGYTLDMVDVSQPSWRDVQSGAYDVAMSRRMPPKSHSNVISSLFLPQQAFLLVNKQSPLASLSEVDFEHDLRKKTCLCMFDYLEEELDLYSRKLKITFKTTSPNLLIVESIVSREPDTVCLLPELTARTIGNNHESVVCIPLANFPIALDAYLLHRKNPPTHVSAFLSDLRQAYAKTTLDSTS